MRIIVCIFVFLFSNFVMGQVGIGTKKPKSEAILHLESTNKGVLFPMMNTAQRDAINPTSIHEGLVLYNTQSECLEFWNGTHWICVGNMGVKISDPQSSISNVSKLGTRVGELFRHHSIKQEALGYVEVYLDYENSNEIMVNLRDSPRNEKQRGGYWLEPIKRNVIIKKGKNQLIYRLRNDSYSFKSENSYFLTIPMPNGEGYSVTISNEKKYFENSYLHSAIAMEYTVAKIKDSVDQEYEKIKNPISDHAFKEAKSNLVNLLDGNPHRGGNDKKPLIALIIDALEANEKEDDTPVSGIACKRAQEAEAAAYKYKEAFNKLMEMNKASK